jgi:hypothetical protein
VTSDQCTAFMQSSQNYIGAKGATMTRCALPERL